MFYFILYTRFCEKWAAPELARDRRGTGENDSPLLNRYHAFGARFPSAWRQSDTETISCVGDGKYANSTECSTESLFVKNLSPDSNLDCSARRYHAYVVLHFNRFILFYVISYIDPFRTHKQDWRADVSRSLIYSFQTIGFKIIFLNRKKFPTIDIINTRYFIISSALKKKKKM